MSQHDDHLLQETFAKFTPHPEGSVRELIHITFPLMLAALSINVMLFVDRLFLANYSTHTMNAAVSASMVVTVFIVFTTGIAAIAEVFIGQYNGAKQYHKLGQPTWQMLWFALMSAFLLIPIAHFGGPLLIAERYATEGIPFFKILMSFTPLMPAFMALAAFFIGQGKVKLIMIVSLIGNVINMIGDYFLIFGVEGILPPLGAVGAAWATVIAQFSQIVILLFIFLNRRHRSQYGTMQWRLNLPLFWNCLRVGAPTAVGHMIEISAWAFNLRMMSWASEEHVTIMAVGQSIFLLFAFMAEGLNKGVIAVAANYIGAKKYHRIPHMLKSALKMHVMILSLIALPLLIFPNLFIDGFLSSDLGAEKIHHLHHLLHVALFFCWCYLIADGLVWIFAGILTAAGDTMMVMAINAFNAWFMAAIPIYLIVVAGHGSPIVSWELIVFYGFVNAAAFFVRYRSNAWQKRTVISH